MQRQNTASLSQLSFYLMCQIKKLSLLYWIRVNTVCPRNSEIRGKQVLHQAKFSIKQTGILPKYVLQNLLQYFCLS